MNISQTSSVRELQKLGQEGGRIRFAEWGTLYVRDKRSGNRLNRAFEKLTGFTTTKRQDVLWAVQRVCRNNGVNFIEAMKNSGLSDYELAKVFAGKGDLKAKHLNAALAKFVQVGGLAFKIEGHLGAGGNSQVLLARNGETGLALERVTHETQSHIVQKYDIVEGSDGTLYQPVDVAVSDGEMLVRQRENLARAQDLLAQRGDALTPDNLREKRPPLTQWFLDKSAKNATLTAALRGWLGGLQQVPSAGVADRDAKLGNYLLSPTGQWLLTDTRTSGNDKGIPLFELTGNENDLAKSPEWLRSDRETGVHHRVGHQDEVFGFGVAAYRLLAGGRFPFDGKQGEPDAELAGIEAYAENVAQYEKSKMSFSEWHKQQTGHSIPNAWKPLLNGALHADPQQRLSADKLRKLDLFKSELDIQKDREAMARRLVLNPALGRPQ